MYQWDRNKARANRLTHGVAFDAVRDFDWAAALETDDDREDYGETRTAAIGPIKGRLYVLIYTPRDEEIRVISLRKATRREAQIYAEAQAKFDPR